MGIMMKSFGMLLDELITNNVKLFMVQEDYANEDDHVVAEAARKALKLNARRNQLIRVIDELLGNEDITVTEKTYG